MHLDGQSLVPGEAKEPRCPIALDRVATPTAGEYCLRQLGAIGYLFRGNRLEGGSGGGSSSGMTRSRLMSSLDCKVYTSGRSGRRRA